MAEFRAGDVAVVRAEKNVAVRGPKSNQVKFDNHFCAGCNNRRSQPFDVAYDRFIEWYLGNEDEVERTGLISLDEVYDEWERGRINLLRYFVKHIGSRIADAGFTVPESLRQFLNGYGEPVGLRCSFEINGIFSGINTIIKRIPTEHGTAGNLYLGPIFALPANDGHVSSLRAWWGYHGLQVVWEWNSEYPQSWTNLQGPRGELPLVEQSERKPLERVAQPGAAGSAWRTWYGLRRRLGFGLTLG